MPQLQPKILEGARLAAVVYPSRREVCHGNPVHSHHWQKKSANSLWSRDGEEIPSKRKKEDFMGSGTPSKRAGDKVKQ